MQVPTVHPLVHAPELAPEKLAHNSSLTEQQKIAEASRQFEAILLRQVLSETQKPMITSKFSDNSVSGGIYRDMVTNQLADSMSKSGGIGLAQTFERQLSHQAAAGHPAGAATGPTGTQPCPGVAPPAKPAAHSKYYHPPLMHGAYYLMKHT